MNGPYRFIGVSDKRVNPNVVYILTLHTTDFKGSIVAQIVGSVGQLMWQCPYDSYDTFRNNWEPLGW